MLVFDFERLWCVYCVCDGCLFYVRCVMFLFWLLLVWSLLPLIVLLVRYLFARFLDVLLLCCALHFLLFCWYWLFVGSL